MMQEKNDIKKVFSFVGENNSWDLTDNEELAKKDNTYTLATIEDLHDMVAMGSYVFKGLVETVDGIVQWFEEAIVDEHGFEDYVCEYRKISN